MKVKLEVLARTFPSLKTLAQKEMSAAMSYRLSKIVKEVSSELEMFDKTRMELIKKNGTHVEATNSYKIAPDKVESVSKELDSLMQEEVELKVDKRLAFSDIEHLSLSAAVLADLIPLFIDEPVSEDTATTPK